MVLWLKSVVGRTGTLLRTVLFLGVIGIAILIPTTVATVEYTAQPEFCISCHIMQPYYDSWASSAHADVSCIECHYEPGTLETVEGKFKALSQLSKYATQTEGTKPWAEVSDASCMRSGCHSVRMLEGAIDFGRVKFDHRHHLLESRRGRRLRCTSCHSQIVQGDHVSVTESVCITCHFMPVDGVIPAETSDCLICHGPPPGSIEVAGQPFVHEEFLARGVDCRECHDPVLEGDGMVRRERCHSCHGEVGHIERFEETAFLHEMHVTDHKVECFECHDEIFHGLLPLEPPPTSKKEGCNRCHVDSHDATRLLLSGTGGVGVEDNPSRMFEARVVCAACHTGRAGRRAAVIASGDPAHHGARAPQVARAGAVDCIHCHGPGVDGMLEAWQASVEDQLTRLHPLLGELEGRLGDMDAETRGLFEEARSNVLLIEMDGSRGAHNVNYAIDVLEAAAQSLESVQARFDAEPPLGALVGFPFRSKVGCSDCHLGMEHAEPIALGRSDFSHRVHMESVGLDCNACHSALEHGEPSFSRDSCASCHHAESEDPGSEFDPWECSSCHAHQENYVLGELEGFEELPGPMAEKDCDACHGEPPDIASPNVNLCALCHDDEYPALPAQWSARTAHLVAELEAAITEARARGEAPEKLRQAERALEAVAADGSGGAHNIDLTERLLRDALEGL